MEEFLRNWDMEPTSAATVAAALEIVRETNTQGRPFGVILIDSSMPEMSDLAFARRILRDPVLGDAHIILLTTLGSVGQSVAASGLGIVHRIPKPPKLLDLLTVMSRLLGTTELRTNSPSVNHDEKTGDRLNELRILVAEDNPINRILAIRMLEKMGQTVSAVEDGEAVLAALEESDFDLILMDVEMPRKDGLETTKAIREREALTGKHIAIIAMTAHVLEEDRDRFLRGGMDGHVSKPIDWKQLVKTMQRIT